MIEDKVPSFDLDVNDINKIKGSIEFHERIIKFISLNLNETIDSDILCYFISDGIDMKAELPRNSYKQALKTSLDFFKENEAYEKCNAIKELIEKI